jgi:hypothetical protein
MPGFDRSGPGGIGPRTGRGRGLCGNRAYGIDAPARSSGGRGRGGLRRGGGKSRCFGRGAWLETPEPWSNRPAGQEDEARALREELALARQQVLAMETRLQELEQESERSNE